MSIKSNLDCSYKTTDICIWSLLELLEHVELITYLVAFEFYTTHLGVLKGAAAFLLTLFSISLTHCYTNRYHRIANLLIKRPVVCNRNRSQTIYKPITRYEQHFL